MRGRGAAATPDNVEAEFSDEPFVRVGETLGREVVVRVPVDHARKASVRKARQHRTAVLCEIAQVLSHFGRARRAVQADDIGLHRFNCGERGTDFAADQHAARCFDGDLHHDRNRDAARGHCSTGSNDCGLRLQEVVDRFNQDDVDTTGEEANNLCFVVVAQLCERDLSERRQTSARSDRSDHVTLATIGCESVGYLARDLRGALVDLKRLVFDAVLAEE